jgi:hypothetical protein
VAAKGGGQPKKEAFKNSHVAATVCGPAKGKMYDILWTFCGSEHPKNLLEGTKRAYAQKTENGWPDETSWRIFAKRYVKQMKDRGLEKSILFCDNADLHMDPVVNAIFIENKVTLLGLVKSGTGFQQPLDVDFFGQLKPLAVKIAGEMGIVPCDDNLAMLFERAMERIEQRATQKGTSALASGFKKPGLHPFNPDPFTDKQMAASVLATGLTRDHPAVKKATESAKKWGEFARDEVAKAIDLADPKLSLAYRKGLDVAQKKGLSLDIDDDVLDAKTGAARYVYTSDAFAEAAEARAEAKRLAEVQAAAAAEERRKTAKANREAAEARSEAFKKRVAESKEKKAREAAEKLARKAARVLKAAPAAAPAFAAPAAPLPARGKRQREAEAANGKKKKVKK